MLKKFAVYLASLFGAGLSVYAFFGRIIESYLWKKYSRGGIDYTYEQLRKSFIEDIFDDSTFLLIFIFSIIIFSFFAVSGYIKSNKNVLTAVLLIISGIASFLSLHYVFNVDIGGEGLEMFLLIPLAFISGFIQIIIFIFALLNIKSKKAIISFIIFNGSASVFVIIAELFYQDLQLLVLFYILFFAFIYYILLNADFIKTAEKTEFLKVTLILISVFAVFGAIVSATYYYKDIDKRAESDKSGYIYVGNDGKEKERAAFNIDGFNGYYAYKINYNDYVEYKDGDYCVVEGYDFSSKDITLPYELNGKEAIYNNDFFAFLAKNKDKYNNIIIDERLNYINRDGFILDKEKQRLLYVYLGDSEEVTIPESTELILDSAFSNKNIRKIIFNDKIHSLRSHCFENCPMKELNIPDKTDTFAGVGNDNAEILGTAPELETVNIGKGCYRCNIGRFDKNVRANNEKKGRTLTVNTESLNDLLKLGTVLYNYENVVFNINYDKSLYYDNDEYFESYEIQHSDFYKEYQNCKNNTIYLSKSFDGITYKTEITINFAKGIKTDF